MAASCSVHRLQACLAARCPGCELKAHPQIPYKAGPTDWLQPGSVMCAFYTNAFRGCIHAWAVCPEWGHQTGCLVNSPFLFLLGLSIPSTGTLLAVLTEFFQAGFRSQVKLCSHRSPEEHLLTHTSLSAHFMTLLSISCREGKPSQACKQPEFCCRTVHAHRGVSRLRADSGLGFWAQLLDLCS